MKRRQFIALSFSLAVAPTLWEPAKADNWHTIGSSLSQAEAETVLNIHNKARAAVGVQPLAWSKDLAQIAQAWADYLAREGKFEHSGVSYGENLAGGFNVQEAMQLWLDEKQHYRPGSRGSNIMQVGHYTQMVWSSTKLVGCGRGKGQTWDIYVCNYDPRGNVMGEDPY